MQQHLFVGGEVAAYRGIVHAGPAGDIGQGHRRDTRLQRQRACGFYQRCCALALLALSTGALERELRHRARITQVGRLRVALEPGSVRLGTSMR